MTSEHPSISVVLATYERPDELEAVLGALADQRGRHVEVVVADDGSGEEVRRVIESWSGRIELSHVWQPKNGFRKARALDLAAQAARGDYLVFLDADCVPRRGFLSAIRKGARPGWFLSTKRVMLGESFSRRVVNEQLPIWRWSAWEWFVRAPREVGRPGPLLPVRDRRRPWRAGSADFTPPDHAYSLIGVFRRDFEGVNGYDARCQRVDDGEDQDLAVRLRRSGLRCGWAGPASTVLHLWHPPRSYRVDDRVPVFRSTQLEDRVQAVIGLRELAGELRGSGDRVPG
jgi:glycosyltransferase involved in cell wall biosynthesis